MNRLAKKFLTASVLLTMILSLMPAINARADGGYIATAIPDKQFSTGVNTGGSTEHYSYAEFNISYQGNVEAAFCMNYAFKAPTPGGVKNYTAITVKPTSQNQAELLDTYAGSPSRVSPNWSGAALYQKVMTVLYYGYGGDGGEDFFKQNQSLQNQSLQSLSDQRKELYRIATQFAIWHYTDGNTAFSKRISKKEEFFQKVAKGLTDVDGNLDWVCRVYDALVSDSLKLKDDFYQNHELTIYVAPDPDDNTAKGSDWQNMISVHSIRERKSKDFYFSKVDVNGSKELPGAQLSVTGKDDRGNDVNENWTSGTDKDVTTGQIIPHKFKLYPGSYIMTETQAPNGFQKTEEKVKFKVTDDLKIELENGGSQVGKVDDNGNKVVMTNKPSPTVFVSKQDSDSHVEIAGAQLQITGHSDGKNIDDKEGENITPIKWSSKAGKSHQVNLYFGTYKLEEINPPTGYENAASITFKVVKDDNDSSKGKIQIKQINGDFTDFNGNTLVMLDKKKPNTPPDNPKTPPDNPKTPPDNPKTPPDKPSTPPTPNTPPNTPQNPNNGHSAPQVAGAKRSEPVTPGTPVTPVTPSNGGHAPGVAGAQRSPETADATPIVLLLGIMSFAAVGLGIFMHKWKKLG